MTRPVLVLGAAGFIGRHIAESLAASGRTVLAACRSEARFDSPAIRPCIARFDQAGDFLPLLGERSLVIHAASSTTPGSSAAQPQIEGNLRTTLALLEALQAQPSAHLVFLSSGGTLYGPSEHAAREHDPLLPRSYHGAGKAAAEHFIHAWSAQFGGRATIIRPGNVYGPGQSPRSGFAAIPTAFRALLTGAEFTVYGDGGTERDFLYIDDLIELILRVIERAKAPRWDVLNAGSGRAITLGALLDAIERTAGERLRRVHKAARPVDVRRTVLDCSRAAALGWTPQVPLEEGLAKTWAWLRDQ